MLQILAKTSPVKITGRALSRRLAKTNATQRALLAHRIATISDDDLDRLIICLGPDRVLASLDRLTTPSSAA